MAGNYDIVFNPNLLSSQKNSRILPFNDFFKFYNVDEYKLQTINDITRFMSVDE